MILGPTKGPFNALKHKHPHPVPKRPYDERVFHKTFSLLRGTPRPGEGLRTPLECQPDVKLDARAARHLRHPMPPIDHVHDALHVGFQVQRGVQRDVRDGRRELTMREDVCMCVWSVSEVALNRQAYRRIA